MNGLMALRAYVACGSWLVVDHHRLLQPLGQVGRERARQDVAATTGGVRNHDVDGFKGEILPSGLRVGVHAETN
jgi:hypothetical protein